MNCKFVENWRYINENGESLPELWERRISKTYSKLLKNLIFYYKNTITNGTQWDEPNPDPEHTKFSVSSETPTPPTTTQSAPTPEATPTSAPTSAPTPEATPEHTPAPTSAPTPNLKQSFGLMNTQSFIDFLKKNGIKYNEQTNTWFDTNKNLKYDSDTLLYLNLFKYKSRVHDLLDILDSNDIVSSLLTHLKTEPGNIIQLIENRIKQKQGKEYIECLDVRKLTLENIKNILQELNVSEQVNLQYWDTSNFTSMQNMFSFKTKSQSISTMFDIKETIMNKTTNIDVTGLKYWNTSKVTSMNSMFRNNLIFNEELNWDTSKVIDMSNMFNNATSFNQPVHTWDTSQVVDMSSMFKNATMFNQPVHTWDTSKVVDMSSMFNNATSFNQAVCTWDTSKVFDMRNMFNNATSFNQNIPWETKVIFDDNIITDSKAELTFKYYTPE